MKAIEEIAKITNDQMVSQIFKDKLSGCLNRGEYTLMYRTNFNQHLK
jgi:hypothetical protein